MEEKTSQLPVFEETAPYTIPTEYYGDGLRLFQKLYVLRRSYIMMAIFLLLMLSFVWAAIENPSSTVAYVLMMVCAAMAFLSWYNPRRQRRSIMEAVRELEGTQYTAQYDGRVLRIRSCSDHPENAAEEPAQMPESRLLTEDMTVREMEQFYFICEGKRMFYILPKAALSEQAASISPPADAEPEADMGKDRETDNRKENQ